MGEYREGQAKAVRPREAATLILVRGGANPRILMGKRAATHKFMPNKFVFPGGRLDQVDQRLSVPSELNQAVLARLRSATRKDVTDNKLRGLALAAVRETVEETGLVIGHKTSSRLRSKNPIWQQYFDHGVEPPLAEFEFVARALTPTYRTRRFDARFFMVYEDCIHSDMNNMDAASGELLDLHWLTPSEARDLDLPIVTRWVIDLVDQRLQRRTGLGQVSVPYMRYINGKAVITAL